MPKRQSQGLNLASKPRNLRCGTMKIKRKKVLKMLAVMEQQQTVANEPSSNPCGSDKGPEEFLQSGRTGRRNALPNILSEHALVSSSDLPARIEALTTVEQKPNADGGNTDSANQPGPSTTKS